VEERLCCGPVVWFFAHRAWLVAMVYCLCCELGEQVLVLEVNDVRWVGGGLKRQKSAKKCKNLNSSVGFSQRNWYKNRIQGSTLSRALPFSRAGSVRQQPPLNRSKQCFSPPPCLHEFIVERLLLCRTAVMLLLVLQSWLLALSILVSVYSCLVDAVFVLRYKLLW
jgi:hypothetical protein